MARITATQPRLRCVIPMPFSIENDRHVKQNVHIFEKFENRSPSPPSLRQVLSLRSKLLFCSKSRNVKVSKNEAEVTRIRVHALSLQLRFGMMHTRHGCMNYYFIVRRSSKLKIPLS